MKNNKLFIKAVKVPCALAAVLFAVGTGNVVKADDVHAGVNITVAPNVFAAQDDYVYYPAYHVYYSKHSHRYAYLENNAWVAAPTPPNVSVDVLRATPSVAMDFHDSPAAHHSDMMRKYPKDWKPDHRDDKR